MNFPEDASLSHNGTRITTTPTLIITGMAFVFLACFGFVFNAAVIHTFRKTRHLQTPTNFFIVGLASNDLAMVTIGMPIVAASCFNGTWIFGPTLCIAYGFFTTLGGVTSISILTAIAMDRFLIVTKSRIARKLSVFKVLMIMLGCVVYGLVWATLPLLGCCGGYVQEKNKFSCGPDWHNSLRTSGPYNVAILIWVFVIPVSLILYCYSKIVLVVRNNRRQVDQTVSVPLNNVRQITITRAVFYVIAAFLLAWSPYAVLSLWTMANDIATMPEVVAVLPPLLAKSSNAWNPLIYVASNRDFRRAFWGSVTRSSDGRDIDIARRTPINSGGNDGSRAGTSGVNMENGGIIHLKSPASKVFSQDYRARIHQHC